MGGREREGVWCEWLWGLRWRAFLKGEDEFFFYEKRRQARSLSLFDRSVLLRFVPPRIMDYELGGGNSVIHRHMQEGSRICRGSWMGNGWPCKQE